MLGVRLGALVQSDGVGVVGVRRGERNVLESLRTVRMEHGDEIIVRNV